MSRISLFVEVTPQAAVLGDGRHGVLPVEIDLDLLTSDQRVLLAEQTRTPRSYDEKQYGGPYIEHEQYIRIVSLPAATQAVVTAWLDSILAERADRKAAAERRAAQRAQEARKALEEALALPAEEWVQRASYERKYIAGIPDSRGCGSEIEALIRSEYAAAYEAKLAEATAIATEKTTRLVAEWEAAEAEKRAKQAAAVERLKQWALEHGSERLKLMLEMQVGNWRAVARSEFFTVNSPVIAGLKLTADEYREIDDYEARSKPAFEELRVLKEARALCDAQPQIYTDAQLGWASKKVEGEDGEEETTHFPIVLVDIYSPDGESTRVCASLLAQELA